jgi:hypothetical protein
VQRAPKDYVKRAAFFTFSPLIVWDERTEGPSDELDGISALWLSSERGARSPLPIHPSVRSFISLYVLSRFYSRNSVVGVVTEISVRSALFCGITQRRMIILYRPSRNSVVGVITEISVRSALFCGIAQRRMIILYRRFGTTYRSHLLGSRRILY